MAASPALTSDADVVFEIAHMPEPADAYAATLAHLVSVVNRAYEVETGDSGVGFKCTKRLHNDDDVRKMEAAIHEGRCLWARQGERILGLMIFEQPSGPEHALYFGPFAVDPDLRGAGLGRRFLTEIERVARSLGARCIDIDVVNVRSDIIPWYSRHGYALVGEAPFPVPERTTRAVHFVLMRKTLE